MRFARPAAHVGSDALIREVARRRPGVRALLISGYASEALDNFESALEGVALLQKPFKKADLARALRSALDRE